MTGVPPKERKCPFCAEPIHPEAVVCKHCGSRTGTGADLICDRCSTGLRPVPALFDDATADALRVEPLCIELSGSESDDVVRDLAPLWGEMPVSLAARFGVVVPRVQITTGTDLEAGAARLLLHGEIADELHFESANPTDLVGAVEEVVSGHLQEFLSRGEVAALVNHAHSQEPSVVAELVPNLLSLGQVRQVLQHLVSEQVSIRNLPLILNVLADSAYQTKDTFQLAELVRTALARAITNSHKGADGTVRALALPPSAESELMEARQYGERGQYLAVDAESAATLISAVSSAAAGPPERRVLVCPSALRRLLAKLLRGVDVAVLSREEIDPAATLDTVTVDLHDLAVARDRRDHHDSARDYLSGD